MATMEYNLTNGIWQDLGSTGILLDKDRKINVEVANADSLPVGSVPCHVNRKDAIQIFPAPSSGNWYVRSASLDTKITVTAV
jgi:hypothetical protein